MIKSSHLLAIAVVFAMVLSACSSHKSQINSVGKVNSKTGIKYSEESYQPPKFKEAQPAPGLVLIPGGSFIMGGGEKDIEFLHNNHPRRVTVTSFYIDIQEVANVDWKMFLADILRNEGQNRFEDLLPDTNVWRRDLAFNDPLAETYYSHPAFNMYPVVGVNWHQANEFCKWRTEAVNSRLDEEKDIKFPSYRLPTEAEWEYAARGLLESEVYTWEGKSLRNRKGQFRANFKRGRNDYAGWRGGDGKHYTDGYPITAPVGEFYPNDFGLYNMSGNVSEWTLDTYRALAYEDVDGLNPYRRKGKTEIQPEDWLDDISYKSQESLLFNPDNSSAVPSSNSEFDNVKVYRGGSWSDVAYYLSPGVRRFFNADSSDSNIGFRCAMIRVGSPE